MRLERLALCALVIASAGSACSSGPANPDANPNVADLGASDLAVFAADLATPDLAEVDIARLPAPTLTSISPSHQPSSSEGIVTLTGTNFVAGAQVFFGANQSEQMFVSVNSPTEIRAPVPAPEPPGLVDVKVTNPDGQSAVLAKGYTYDFSQLSFARPAAQSTGLMSPRSAVVVDLDKDGRSDVVAYSYFSSAIAVLKAQPDGTLGAATMLAEAAKPNGIATGDFNNDGWPDIVTAEPLGPSVGIRLNDGMGNLGAVSVVALPAKSVPGSVAVGDFNGDHNLDIAVCLQGALSVAILLGDGSGKYMVAANSPKLSGMDPADVYVGHFDADPALDIVVTDNSATMVSWFSGAANGTFNAENRLDLTIIPEAFVVADLDGNGFDDFAATPGDTTGVRLFMNSKTGFVAAMPVLPGDKSTGLGIGDVTFDGKPDLAPADNVQNFIHVLGSDGVGGYTKKIDVNIATGVSWVQTGDFNGDGLMDFVTLSFYENSPDVQVMLNTSM